MKSRTAIGLTLVWLLITICALFLMAVRDIKNESDNGSTLNYEIENVYYVGTGNV